MDADSPVLVQQITSFFQPFSSAAMGTWEAGVFDYRDLVAQYINQGDYIRYFEADAKVPWLYSATAGVMISYDDPEFFNHKLDYLKQHQLGGAMFWELSGDSADAELLNILAAELLSE
mgnify:CR=1 FL=1